MKYIIGSGWWCSSSDDEREKLYGDNDIRNENFHYHWYAAIRKYTSPTEIIIVDSNSPIKPKWEIGLKVISLNENAGHSTNHTGKYSGWMRSVIHSMSYAQNCDCDYYVYIEQDALIFGEKIIENCIAKMNKPYMFGKCKDFNNPLQQSFFIIKKEYIDSFLAKIFLIPFSDSEMPPERKFALATSDWFFFIPKFLLISSRSKFIKKITWRLQNIFSKAIGNYNYLPIGYGRDRPINMSDRHFYFQHGSADELNEYFNK